MNKFIAVAAFVTVQWQTASAQTILGSIPDEFQGDWCRQESTEIFRSGACKPKSGSLSIERMTLAAERLSCVFDSGTASNGTLKMRLYCSDPEEKQPSLYGAQLKLRSDRKIELIVEPLDQK
jgi:hypothetical protein